MSYLHILNLYKEQKILLFKRCYALEKIHGTSAHVSWNPQDNGGQIGYFSGGEKHINFISLFDREKLTELFKSTGLPPDRTTFIFGEAYGGKCQGMSETYGKNLKFIAFDVKVGDSWLDVPNAEKIVQKIGLEFVYYKEISTNLVEIDAERDADSQQAIRNGCGPGKKREGIVLRPLIEVKLNNDERIITKHKRDDFAEIKSPRPIVDPANLQVLADAEMVANEWVTFNRLIHILQKFPDNIGMEKTRDIIYAMVEDIMREGKGEIVPSDSVNKSIGKKTVELFKIYLKNRLTQNQI